jgi:Restriction endonuclease
VIMIGAFLSIALAVMVAALGEMVSDEIRARLDRLPLALLAAAARRLPVSQRADVYEQAWLPELHYVLRGDQAMPITRLVHGLRFAFSLWLTAPRIGMNLEDTLSAEPDDIATPGSYRDLLSLRPVEFESLIRDLFAKIGARSLVTQPSPDGGVDAVMINEDPVTGGIYVVQAKRYIHDVGIHVVQELERKVESKRAAKGVLITTSAVSDASRDYAARSGKIDIVDGPLLTSLLSRYLDLDLPHRPPPE